MNAVVATPLADAPASRALYAEGIPFTERVVLGEFGYGELVTELWNTGADFVLIEWDIIPWPGATAALDACRHGWCAHRYPLHRGNLALSFGINKFKPEGPAPDDWATTRGIASTAPWSRCSSSASAGSTFTSPRWPTRRRAVADPGIAYIFGFTLGVILGAGLGWIWRDNS